MDGTTPGPDELRIRSILRRRGVGYDAGPPPVPRKLPAGYEAAREPDWFDDLVEYNAPAAPPPATERTETAEATHADPEPETDEREPRDWTWLTSWLRPWQTLTAGLASVFPAFNGYSLATGWAAALHDMRTTEAISAAYTYAGVVLALAFVLDFKRRRWLLRVFLITAVIGALGALDWFDPITFVTGVHR